MSSDSGNHNADRTQNAANGEDSAHVEMGRLERELESARAELRLEAALERVRVKAMTMESSDDIGATTLLLFDEIKALCPNVLRAGIGVVESVDEFHPWVVGLDETGDRVLIRDTVIRRGDKEEMDKMTDAWSEGKGYYFKESKEFLQWVVDELYKGDSARIIPVDAPHDQYLCSIIHKTGFLFVVADHPVTMETEEGRVISRFATAYDVAYQRYRDLKVAEVQIREAQIEAALERIRGQAMAMQESTDLLDIVVTMHAEYSRHGFEPGYFWHMKWTPTTYEKAMTSGDGSRIGMVMELPRGFSGNQDLADWETSDEPIGVFKFDVEGAVDYVNRMVEKGKFHEIDPDAPTEQDIRDIGGLTIVMARTTHGEIGYSLHGPTDPAPGACDVLVRFAGAFDLAYRRFEDLKHAEAQTREAQIEAAVERVRSQAMAMHSSDDLLNVVQSIRRELLDLGLEHSIASNISIVNDDDSVTVTDISSIDEGGEFEHLLTVLEYNSRDSKYLSRQKQGWDCGETYYIVRFEKEEMPLLADEITAMDAEIGAYLRTAIQEGLVPQMWTSVASFSRGFLGADFVEPPGSDVATILPKMAAAFDLAYTRFEDLMQAEAQAREAQIDAALERVRSRTMAMQRSEELADIVGKIFEELTQLDFVLTRCIIWIFDNEKNVSWWMANPEAESGAESYDVGYNEYPVFQAHLEAWQKRTPVMLYTLSGDAKVEFDDHIFNHSGLANLPKVAQDGMREPEAVYLSNSLNDFGLLMAASLEPLSDENLAIVQRFGWVFQQSYTRFTDVKKAESQAREAQIEAAMERVRSRATAMHSSDELMDVSMVLRQEMGLLGQGDIEVCGIHLYEEDEDFFESWGAIRAPGDAGEILTAQSRFPKSGAKILEEVMGRYQSDQNDYILVTEGEKAKEWLEIMKEHAPMAYEKIEEMIAGVGQEEMTAYWSFSDFSGGSLLMVTHTPPEDESRDLLRRSANVFDLAYRRFLDLKKAEAQAREARIEASLERVRGRAMAMQKPEDLGDVSILMFDELAGLGIDSLRSGITLPLDDERYEFRAATKKSDGTTTLVVGNESINVHPIIRRAFDGYQDREEYQKTILKGNNLVEYYHAVFDTMPLPDWKERMEIGAEAQEGFATFPFSDGWLYTFTREELDNEQISVFIRFAKVFGLAYQRYHDLTQAEIDYQALLEEKARTEKTLEELHATQAQLIEQEKLASLGSLTAGIAHEIKNPLNFVNNFAEVSEELVEELCEAVAAGNVEETRSLLGEISENAAQIAKHGKRADSIVKAMMQHARGGASDPESVNLNEFVDEYVNLSWHGMRAKNHGFQTEVIRKYDKAAGEITIQPQEMGRVLLNLLNNAFDALKGTDDATVTVQTERNDDAVVLTISDNGPGIPADIREKIFEPFFTTKATGEGTGLGLSISYDIVTKGHSGILAVESAPGEGAAFKITLPA